MSKKHMIADVVAIIGKSTVYSGTNTVKPALSGHSKRRPKIVFMPPKELWEAYSNRTVRPSARPSRFVSGAYLLYSLM